MVIYPNDHRPAHVHVVGAGGEAVFLLNCPGGPPTLRESYDLKLNVLNAIQAHLQDALSTLCTQWEQYHGDF